jgi:hypothetical protein
MEAAPGTEGRVAAGLEEPRIATHPRFEAAGRYRSNLSTL